MRPVNETADKGCKPCHAEEQCGSPRFWCSRPDSLKQCYKSLILVLGRGNWAFVATGRGRSFPGI